MGTRPPSGAAAEEERRPGRDPKGSGEGLLPPGQPQGVTCPFSSSRQTLGTPSKAWLATHFGTTFRGEKQSSSFLRMENSSPAPPQISCHKEHQLSFLWTLLCPLFRAVKIGKTPEWLC